MELRRITGILGVEVTGLSLTGGPDEATAKGLRMALAEHGVVVLRGQYLDRADQIALTEAFGAPMQLPYVTPTTEDARVIAVLKEASERGGGVFGGDWHADFSFLENPPAGSILSAEEVPPQGGDTLWACQKAAWRTLPVYLKDMLKGRDAIHVGKPYGVKFAPPAATRANGSIEMTRGDPNADHETRHPAMLTHPETGQWMLFVNPIYTTRLSGMTEEESRPILAQLYAHATRPDLSMRHRWQAGDVVIWDNRATLHYATNDYDGYRRLLYRTTYQGTVPA